MVEVEAVEAVDDNGSMNMKFKRNYSGMEGDAVGITIDGVKHSITDADASGKNSAKLKSTLETKFGKSLPNVFVHKNRDGSFALATDVKPKVWPEDDV